MSPRVHYYIFFLIIIGQKAHYYIQNVKSTVLNIVLVLPKTSSASDYWKKKNARVHTSYLAISRHLRPSTNQAPHETKTIGSRLIVISFGSDYAATLVWTVWSSPNSRSNSWEVFYSLVITRNIYLTISFHLNRLTI